LRCRQGCSENFLASFFLVLLTSSAARFMDFEHVNYLLESMEEVVDVQVRSNK
jgi:hypothetical protein